MTILIDNPSRQIVFSGGTASIDATGAVDLQLTAGGSILLKVPTYNQGGILGWDGKAIGFAYPGDTATTSSLKSLVAGVILATDGSTGVGKLLFASVVEANTAGSGSPNILTVTESRTTLTNEGTSAENYHTLPSAAAGLDFEFICQDADGIRVVANTGNTIRIAGSVSATAGFIKSTAIGSVIRLKAINATEWFAVSAIGTWTIDA